MGMQDKLPKETFLELFDRLGIKMSTKQRKRILEEETELRVKLDLDYLSRLKKIIPPW